jgi:hypothetical protein
MVEVWLAVPMEYALGLQCTALNYGYVWSFGRELGSWRRARVLVAEAGSDSVRNLKITMAVDGSVVTSTTADISLNTIISQ